MAGYGGDYVTSIYDNGFISDKQVNSYIGVRPVLYLKSNIQIESGDGSEQHPYVFKL